MKASGKIQTLEKLNKAYSETSVARELPGISLHSFNSIRKNAPIILLGLAGILIAVVIINISFDLMPMALSILLIFFITAQGIWLNESIRSLKFSLKTKKSDPVSQAHSLLVLNNPLPMEESLVENAHAPEIKSAREVSDGDSQPKECFIELEFFHQLIKKFENAHPTEINVRCLQDGDDRMMITHELCSLIKTDQMVVLTQPVVNMPQKRLSFFHCSPCMNIKNVTFELDKITATEGQEAPFLELLKPLQMIILFKTLQFIRGHHARHPMFRFICYLPEPLHQDTELLQSLFAYLQQIQFPFHGVVFEIPLYSLQTNLDHLDAIGALGVKFIGKWQNQDLPDRLSDLSLFKLDFIAVGYENLRVWSEKWPRRQAVNFLQEISKIRAQTIVVNVEDDQFLNQNLPVHFDFAMGAAFGLAKPFHQIQL